MGDIVELLDVEVGVKLKDMVEDMISVVSMSVSVVSVDVRLSMLDSDSIELVLSG